MFLNRKEFIWFDMVGTQSTLSYYYYHLKPPIFGKVLLDGWTVFWDGSWYSVGFWSQSSFLSCKKGCFGPCKSAFCIFPLWETDPLHILSVALQNNEKTLAAHRSSVHCEVSYHGWLWSQSMTTSARTVGPPSSGTRASCLPPRENISMRKGGEGSRCWRRINPGVRTGA